MNTTLDKLLNGRIALYQPVRGEGYRIAVDTLLLAAAVPLCAGQRALDLGCGVGGVMMAMAARVPESLITGLEIQPAMATLCEQNIALNQFSDRLNVVTGDLASLPASLKETFDHVVTNPPFYDPQNHIASAITAKRMARTESGEVDLALWIAQAATTLKEGGMMSMIHRGEKTEEIISLCQPFFARIAIKPIWSKKEGPAKRVIVQAIKDHSISNAPPRALPPFILYGEDGRYSAEGHAILREAGAMEEMDG